MILNKFQSIINNLKEQRFVINYSRMWPYVKPVWFRALCSMLICIPIGSLDAVIALALKPYMDLVMVEKTISSPWYIPLGIVAFTSIEEPNTSIVDYIQEQGIDDNINFQNFLKQLNSKHLSIRFTNTTTNFSRQFIMSAIIE